MSFNQNCVAESNCDVYLYINQIWFTKGDNPLASNEPEENGYFNFSVAWTRGDNIEWDGVLWDTSTHTCSEPPCWNPIGSFDLFFDWTNTEHTLTPDTSGDLNPNGIQITRIYSDYYNEAGFYTDFKNLDPEGNEQTDGSGFKPGSRITAISLNEENSGPDSQFGTGILFKARARFADYDGNTGAAAFGYENWPEETVNWCQNSVCVNEDGSIGNLYGCDGYTYPSDDSLCEEIFTSNDCDNPFGPGPSCDNCKSSALDCLPHGINIWSQDAFEHDVDEYAWVNTFSFPYQTYLGEDIPQTYFKFDLSHNDGLSKSKLYPHYQRGENPQYNWGWIPTYWQQFQNEDGMNSYCGGDDSNQGCMNFAPPNTHNTVLETLDIDMTVDDEPDFDDIENWVFLTRPGQEECDNQFQAGDVELGMYTTQCANIYFSNDPTIIYLAEKATGQLNNDGQSMLPIQPSAVIWTDEDNFSVDDHIWGKLSSGTQGYDGTMLDVFAGSATSVPLPEYPTHNSIPSDYTDTSPITVYGDTWVDIAKQGSRIFNNSYHGKIPSNEYPADFAPLHCFIENLELSNPTPELGINYNGNGYWFPGDNPYSSEPQKKFCFYLTDPNHYDIDTYEDRGNSQIYPGIFYVTGLYNVWEKYEVIEGCTDPSALSYNPKANVDDGSCFWSNSVEFLDDGFTSSHWDECESEIENFTSAEEMGINYTFSNPICEELAGILWSWQDTGTISQSEFYQQNGDESTGGMDESVVIYRFQVQNGYHYSIRFSWLQSNPVEGVSPGISVSNPSEDSNWFQGCSDTQWEQPVMERWPGSHPYDDDGNPIWTPADQHGFEGDFSANDGLLFQVYPDWVDDWVHYMDERNGWEHFTVPYPYGVGSDGQTKEGVIDFFKDRYKGLSPDDNDLLDVIKDPRNFGYCDDVGGDGTIGDQLGWDQGFNLTSIKHCHNPDTCDFRPTNGAPNSNDHDDWVYYTDSIDDQEMGASGLVRQCIPFSPLDFLRQNVEGNSNTTVLLGHRRGIALGDGWRNCFFDHDEQDGSCDDYVNGVDPYWYGEHWHAGLIDFVSTWDGWAYIVSRRVQEILPTSSNAAIPVNISAENADGLYNPNEFSPMPDEYNVYGEGDIFNQSENRYDMYNYTKFPFQEGAPWYYRIGEDGKPIKGPMKLSQSFVDMGNNPEQIYLNLMDDDCGQQWMYVNDCDIIDDYQGMPNYKMFNFNSDYYLNEEGEPHSIAKYNAMWYRLNFSQGLGRFISTGVCKSDNHWGYTKFPTCTTPDCSAWWLPGSEIDYWGCYYDNSCNWEEIFGGGYDDYFCPDGCCLGECDYIPYCYTCWWDYSYDDPDDDIIDYWDYWPEQDWWDDYNDYFDYDYDWS
tara:strand:- start:2304 stop:6386 length:4083 start_codon:yes stop_codon:yes gene_type:complete